MIRSILLVDDDADDSDLFSEALTEIAPSVKFTRAIDGCEALELLEKKNIEPDIIFLDINMPRMDGWQCLKELKNKSDYKNIPVYMYSTSSNKKEIEIALSLGANMFLSKPDSYVLLKKMISSTLEKL